MINEPKTGVEGLTLTTSKESILSDLKEGVLTGNEIAAKHNVSPSYISKLKPKEKKVKPQQSKTVTHKKLSPMKSTKMEDDCAEKAKAERAKEAYQKLQDLQRLEGYRWVSGVCERGIKKMVWTNKI